MLKIFWNKEAILMVYLKIKISDQWFENRFWSVSNVTNCMYDLKWYEMSGIIIFFNNSDWCVSNNDKKHANFSEDGVEILTLSNSLN